MMNRTSSKKHSLLLTITLLMATFAAVASVTMVAPASAQAANDWPMFQHDAAHTGYTDSSGPTSLYTKWWYRTDGEIYSSPAVVDHRVYIGSDDSYVYCLNGATGSLIWKYATGGFVQSSPAVVGGKVYVGSNDNYLYCLTTDGTLVWKYLTGGWVRSPPAVTNDKIYIGSGDRNVYCIRTNGTLVWKYLTGGRISFVSPTVVGGKVYVGSMDSNLYCLNATTGAFIWSYEAGDSIYASSAVVGDGRVFVGSADTYLYALNATTGAFLWKYRPTETNPAIFYDVVDASPTFRAGKVYGAFEHKVVSLNASNKALFWFGGDTGFSTKGSLVLDGNNHLYTGNQDRCIYIFEANTGKRIDYEYTSSTVMSSIAIADGYLYVGNGNGYVYCCATIPTSVSTTMSIFVSPKSLDIAGYVHLEGWLFPSVYLAGVTINYTRPDGTILTHTAQIKQDGKWDDFFNPGMIGSWSAKASFAGLDQFQRSTSTTVNFTVTGTVPLVKTSISCWVDPKSPTSGKTVYVRGGITDPVSGATVTLTYTKPDLTTTTKTVTTASDGSYEDTVNATDLGAWRVQASWTGDATRAGATSNLANFIVYPLAAAVTAPVTTVATPVEITYGIVAMIVIAIVAIIVIWFMGRKKT